MTPLFGFVKVLWSRPALCAVGVILLHFSAGLGVAQDNKPVRFDQKSLKKLAQYILQPPVKVSFPSFVIKDQTLYYFLGDVLLEDGIPVSSTASVPTSLSDPINIPLKDQLRIELLRQYSSLPENRYLAFLEGALQLADQQVAQALRDIHAHDGPSSALLDKLDTHRVVVEKAIDKAVRDYATQQQLNLFKQGRKVLAATVEVSFSCTPPGGLISYVLEFDWRVANQRGESPLWRDVVHIGAVKLAAGTYRIRVKWPNPEKAGGKKESEYTVDILGDGQLDIKP